MKSQETVLYESNRPPPTIFPPKNLDHISNFALTTMMIWVIFGIHFWLMYYFYKNQNLQRLKHKGVKIAIYQIFCFWVTIAIPYIVEVLSELEYLNEWSSLTIKKDKDIPYSRILFRALLFTFRLSTAILFLVRWVVVWRYLTKIPWDHDSHEEIFRISKKMLGQEKYVLIGFILIQAAFTSFLTLRYEQFEGYYTTYYVSLDYNMKKDRVWPYAIININTFQFIEIFILLSNLFYMRNKVQRLSIIQENIFYLKGAIFVYIFYSLFFRMLNHTALLSTRRNFIGISYTYLGYILRSIFFILALRLKNKRLSESYPIIATNIKSPRDYHFIINGIQRPLRAEGLDIGDHFIKYLRNHCNESYCPQYSYKSPTDVLKKLREKRMMDKIGDDEDHHQDAELEDSLLNGVPSEENNLLIKEFNLFLKCLDEKILSPRLSGGFYDYINSRAYKALRTERVKYKELYLFQVYREKYLNFSAVKALQNEEQNEQHNTATVQRN